MNVYLKAALITLALIVGTTVLVSTVTWAFKNHPVFSVRLFFILSMIFAAFVIYSWVLQELKKP